MRGGRRIESPYSSEGPKQQACASPPHLTFAAAVRRPPSLLEARPCAWPSPPGHHAAPRRQLVCQRARRASATVVRCARCHAARHARPASTHAESRSRPLGLQHAETANSAASEPGRDYIHTPSLGPLASMRPSPARLSCVRWRRGCSRCSSIAISIACVRIATTVHVHDTRPPAVSPPRRHAAACTPAWKPSGSGRAGKRATTDTPAGPLQIACLAKPPALRLRPSSRCAAQPAPILVRRAPEQHSPFAVAVSPLQSRTRTVSPQLHRV
jgi:hypothetical protein